MTKKLIGALLVVCMLGTMVGCGKSTEKEEEGSGSKKVVTFYSWAAGSEQEFDKAIVKEFEKENPEIDVKDVYVTWSEYMSKLNTQAAAESLPEVFKLPEGNVLEWGEKGVILDVQPLYEEDGISPEENILETAVFRAEEKVYGVGFDVTTIALYYNKDLFEEAGITPPSSDPNTPWTWEEFVENAKKLTKDANGNTPNDDGFDEENVTVYGTMMPSDWLEFIPLLYTNGSSIADETGTELKINSPEGIEVIQAIADLALKEKCAPTVAIAEGAFSDASTMLMNGQIGMLLDGGWGLSTYANEGYDVGVAQIPAFDHAANMAWTAGLCMAAGNEDNQEAFEFFKFYTTFKNRLDVATNEGFALGGLPHTLDIFDDGENEKQWVEAYTKIDETENCAAFKGILQHENTRIGENATLKNFPAIVDSKLIPALDEVWLGKKTAEEVLTNIDVSSELQGVLN